MDFYGSGKNWSRRETSLFYANVWSPIKFLNVHKPNLKPTEMRNLINVLGAGQIYLIVQGLI